MEDTERPTVFMSYSRTDGEHIQWVVNLAEELVENGVQVILDEWDLQEGQDLYAFMEQAVTSDEVDKVIIICDEEYAQKADQREGGVGEETQIISPELYGEVDPENPQQKFVPVITEKNEEGKAHLPIYLRGRYYIDMSTPESRVDNFDQLLRWAYDKRVNERPELGEPPTFIVEEDGPDLGTGSRANRAKKRLWDGDASALGSTRDYFETFAQNLERLVIEPEGDRPSPEEVIESIEESLPFRDEAVSVFVALSKYWPDNEAQEVLHAFFEGLLPHTIGDHPRHSQDTSADNLAFFVYELFIYAVASLLRHKRFLGVDYLLRNRYYLSKEDADRPRDARLYSFNHFCPSLKSIEDHLDHRRISKTSDFIHDRAGREDIRPESLMQAELILYLRNEVERLRNEDEIRFSWQPNSLLRAQHRHYPFELFSRAARGDSFDPLGTVLNIGDWEELRNLLERITKNGRFRLFGHRGIPIYQLVGLERP